MFENKVLRTIFEPNTYQI